MTARDELDSDLTKWLGERLDVALTLYAKDPHDRGPGELITESLMKISIDFLVRSMKYGTPRQDLSIDLSRIPAVPKSRFVMDNVRLVG